jgi:transcription elongation GreA/GreB family factor
VVTKRKKPDADARSAAARVMGSASSERKTRAVRENAKLGGRPLTLKDELETVGSLAEEETFHGVLAIGTKVRRIQRAETKYRSVWMFQARVEAGWVDQLSWVEPGTKGKRP